jgi:hypothetical protein
MSFAELSAAGQRALHAEAVELTSSQSEGCNAVFRRDLDLSDEMSVSCVLLLFSCLAFSSDLTVEASFSDIFGSHRTTYLYNPQDHIRHCHRNNNKD